MQDDKAFILGFTTFAFAMYLGSKCSPDYKDLINDGSKFLLFVGFGLTVLFGMSLIDYYYKKKNSAKLQKGEQNGKV